MATVNDIKAWLNDPASGPEVYGRNWSGYCQAFAWQVCNAFGSAPVGYPSAYDAYQNSSIVSTNPNDAPAGSFHYWEIAMPDGHVAVGLGGGQCAMGSSKVTDMWATNVGAISVEEYTAKVGGHYLGWSNSNGANTASIDGGSSGDGVQAQIQAIFQAQGLYNGPIDGVFGPNCWAATQQWLTNYGLYSGPIDGDPGTNTYKAFQSYGAKNGNYDGPIDGDLGPRSWDGFLQSLKEDTAAVAPAPAPAPTPAPAPAPDPTPAVAPPTADSVPATPAPNASKPSVLEVVGKDVQTIISNISTVKEAPVSDEVQTQQEAVIASLPAANLGAIIPSVRGRIWAYGAFSLASLIVTNTAIGFASLHLEFPAWLTVAIAIVGNLATPFGALAIANATKK